MKIVYPVTPIRSGGIKDSAGQIHHVQVLVDSANAMSDVIQRVLDADGDDATCAAEMREALGDRAAVLSQSFRQRQ